MTGPKYAISMCGCTARMAKFQVLTRSPFLSSCFAPLGKLPVFSSVAVSRVHEGGVNKAAESTPFENYSFPPRSDVWCWSAATRGDGFFNSSIAVFRRSYSNEVHEHFENPKNVGSFKKGEKNVGTAIVGKAACGDVIKLQVKVNDNGIISDSKFKTFGCGSAIASSSLATEMIKGKTCEEALGLKNTQISQALSLPPVKLHCSLLAEDAVRHAIKDYMSKREDMGDGGPVTKTKAEEAKF